VNVKPLLLALALAAARPAGAEAPQVATDIPPVNSLVARVMQGVGVPGLVLPSGASPHGYSMRPSDARTLAGADIVIWTGAALTPWLGRAIATLAPGAATVELLDVEGTTLLGFREGATFEHRAHAGEPGAEAPADADDGHGGHAPAGVDPHAWLDPQNARAWLGAIAAALAEADPGNAETYRRNAAAAGGELDALMAELSAALAPVRQKPFIVFHDAYRYFEDRFGLEAAGAISLGDASAPSPARIAEIRATLSATRAACVFAEPQFATGLIETVVEGTAARAAVLDPLGVTLAPGPGLYPALLRNLASALRDCLGRAS
jgi:zinc transport system substrate-binding protein